MPPAENRQDLRNHRRLFPLYHFVAAPIVGMLVIHRFAVAFLEPSVATWLEAFFASGLLAGLLSARAMALTVQNRIVRLEMRLRLRDVLPPALASRIGELRVRQLIALRFAGDAELPSLVERTLAGEFANPADIKAAVKDWQPDFLRA
jgi:hypothetical protein